MIDLEADNSSRIFESIAELIKNYWRYSGVESCQQQTEVFRLPKTSP